MGLKHFDRHTTMGMEIRWHLSDTFRYRVNRFSKQFENRKQYIDCDLIDELPKCVLCLDAFVYARCRWYK